MEHPHAQLWWNCRRSDCLELSSWEAFKKEVMQRFPLDLPELVMEEEVKHERPSFWSDLAGLLDATLLFGLGHLYVLRLRDVDYKHMNTEKWREDWQAEWNRLSGAVS